jgi:hypothetical protein|tara:strand:+ start:744 stop:905 length:162 start_codon:yes stop_codon:yes gene_type:complete
MAFPKYNPDYDKQPRAKLISKEIKLLKSKGIKQKQAVAMALNMFPKTKKLPLA